LGSFKEPGGSSSVRRSKRKLSAASSSPPPPPTPSPSKRKGKTTSSSKGTSSKVEQVAESVPATKILPFEEGEIAEMLLDKLDLTIYKPVKLFFLLSASLDLVETKQFFFKAGFTADDDTVLFVVGLLLLYILYI
jgi:hypothetical protein